MPPVGFEPTISAGERPQTCALDHAATGIGCQQITLGIYFSCSLYIYVAELLYESKDAPVHAAMACRGSRGIVPLIFNVSTVWSSVVSFIACPVCTQGKSVQYQLCPFSGRLDGPQTRCGLSEEDNIPWPLLRIRSQMVHLM